MPHAPVRILTEQQLVQRRVAERVDVLDREEPGVVDESTGQVVHFLEDTEAGLADKGSPHLTCDGSTAVYPNVRLKSSRSEAVTASRAHPSMSSGADWTTVSAGTVRPSISISASSFRPCRHS